MKAKHLDVFVRKARLPWSDLLSRQGRVSASANKKSEWVYSECERGSNETAAAKGHKSPSLVLLPRLCVLSHLLGPPPSPRSSTFCLFSGN